jgi:hypothetical protein
VGRISEIDAVGSYKDGFRDALVAMHSEFEKEYSEVATEDPYYAYYIRHVLNMIDNKIIQLENTKEFNDTTN